MKPHLNSAIIKSGSNGFFKRNRHFLSSTAPHIALCEARSISEADKSTTFFKSNTALKMNHLCFHSGYFPINVIVFIFVYRV